MAEAVKDYQKLEHDIIRLAGGADNIATTVRDQTPSGFEKYTRTGRGKNQSPARRDHGCTETGTVSSRDRKSCGRCIRGSFGRT